MASLYQLALVGQEQVTSHFRSNSAKGEGREKILAKGHAPESHFPL